MIAPTPVPEPVQVSQTFSRMLERSVSMQITMEEKNVFDGKNIKFGGKTDQSEASVDVGLSYLSLPEQYRTASVDVDKSIVKGIHEGTVKPKFATISSPRTIGDSSIIGDPQELFDEAVSRCENILPLRGVKQFESLVIEGTENEEILKRHGFEKVFDHNIAENFMNKNGLKKVLMRKIYKPAV